MTTDDTTEESPIDPPPAALSPEEIEAHTKAVYEAIARNLATAYGDQIPVHYGALKLWKEGGPDPLDGVSIYWNAEGAHWHYVSFGMAEHYEKQSHYAGVSGWGFEFSLRLAAPPELAGRGEELTDSKGSLVRWVCTQAPRWPIALLNELGRHVFKSRKTYQHGGFVHRPGAPFLEYLGFLHESSLPWSIPPTDVFVWQQVFPLHADHLDRYKGDDWEALVGELRADNPHLAIQPDQGPTDPPAQGESPED